MMTTGSLVFGMSVFTLLAVLACAIMFLIDRGRRQARSDEAAAAAALLARMRLLEVDHEPDGWPAVRMRDISALCDEIERLQGGR